MEKREQIGKVILDLDKYPGEDFYCDGAVEDEILGIVKNHAPEEYNQMIEEKKSWPVLYHLSALRENIVEWIPMEKGAKVLEVGSGCGAITGALAKKAGELTCVDLSKKRSMINAYRHSECDNVTIHVGNFKDIEPDLDQDYDYICLIGVFEYGKSYIGGDAPYEDFLNILKKHLKADGRLVIAIENKYGLKYFAGCKEDHLGTYFSSIENYADGGGVRTFGRKGLEKIFKNVGVEEYHFYYPYPDYKFMTTVYSDDYLPGKGELSNNLRNFDRDRMLLFDEKNAFDGLVEEDMFAFFSNSFLVVVGADFDTKFAKYSNDRAPEYAIRTQICDTSETKGVEEAQTDITYVAKKVVRKYPVTDAAKEHIRHLAVAYESLVEKYQGGKLCINQCKLVEEKDELYAEFEFVAGTPLSELMDACLEREDLDGFYKLFREYLERIDYNAEYPVADFDLIFANILVDGDTWTLIDYEWTFAKSIPAKELAYRAVYCYLLENKKREKLDVLRVLQELGLNEKDAEAIKEQEAEFQKFVTGQRMAMTQMRDLIGYRMLVPQKWLDKYQDAEGVNRVQIYEDRGNGCSEEASYFVKDAYQGENLIAFEIPVSGDVSILRIDPAMDSCMVKIQEMTFNEMPVPLAKKKMLLTNGKLTKGERPSIVFPTTDPNINIDLRKLERKEVNTLHVRMEIVRLSLAMAEDMAGAVKKWI